MSIELPYFPRSIGGSLLNLKLLGEKGRQASLWITQEASAWNQIIRIFHTQEKTYFVIIATTSCLSILDKDYGIIALRFICEIRSNKAQRIPKPRPKPKPKPNNQTIHKCMHIIHAELQTLVLWLLRITSSCFTCITIVSAAEVVPGGHGVSSRQSLPSRFWLFLCKCMSLSGPIFLHDVNMNIIDQVNTI